jgi:hypothetical protein
VDPNALLLRCVGYIEDVGVLNVNIRIFAKTL